MVPNLEDIDEDEWGDWVPAEMVNFQVGDIFLLDISGHIEGIFKATSLANGSKRDLGMSKYHGNGRWDRGHVWSMIGKTKICFPRAKQEVTVSHPISDISQWQAWATKQPGHCACGIIREQCSYHKI